MVYDVDSYINKGVPAKVKKVIIKNRGKHKKAYVQLYCGFDIETTTLPNHNAYMYHWQFSINKDVIVGRVWADFEKLIMWLKSALDLSSEKRLIVWVANLGFEFQFICKRFDISEMFARETRQPLYFLLNEGYEFHECLTITGGNLAYLAKTYCKTQKMKGDLDYSIIRNYKTPLSNKELQYCYNDVLILSEFSEYVFFNYIIPLKYCPLTKTGILRRQVKKGFPHSGKDIIASCFITQNEYSLYMQYLFRGGFVHANILHVGKKIKGVASFDFTSSYPARMNYSLYPMSPFINRDATKENLYKYIKSHCCILHLIFHNLRSKTPHSIESKSKLINSKNVVVDNGRVHSAELVEVLLTDLDFKVYNMFYDWTQIDIISIKTSVRGHLPKYLLNPMNTAYIEKAKLKKQGLKDTTEYTTQKGLINSAYGLTVTRLQVEDIGFCNGKWTTTTANFNYDEEVNKAFLLPQWGIFVTSCARYELLKTVYKIEKRAKKLFHLSGDVLYCDTDSLKLINYNCYKDIFDNYNKYIEKDLFKSGLDKKYFDDLGKFDLEYTNCDSKFLGAKRYITTHPDGHTEPTIAGLPKKALTDYCDKNKLDIYDVFSNNMILDVTVSTKNTTSYNDNYHEDIVDGIKMSELSSVGIYPIDFTMSLDKLYLYLIQESQEIEKGKEKRIYG